ncbi:MAG: bifunctional pyr operon transcriptional regulator/uracil phosphoribosyltransferase PyrR [Nevskiales bacterium]
MSTNTLPDVNSLLDNMREQLTPLLNSDSPPLMLGIHTGGWWVAQALHQQMGLTEPLGELNSQFHRDDFNKSGLHPNVGPSRLPVSVQDRDVILVDDILYTGRTVRAALNEIFDYGRPRRILLAVMLDRGQRELPIQPDIVGGRIDLPNTQKIKLNGPEPLELMLGEKA